jgi:hypothetical protein
VDLPAPVRHWVERTIADGATFPTRADLDTRGRIRFGRWHRYEACQLLAPPHQFTWCAQSTVAGLPITAVDSYRDGHGETSIAVGPIDVGDREDREVTRSAAGRLAIEAFLLPTTALAPWVSWEPAGTASAVAEVDIDGTLHAVEVEIRAGRLASCSTVRWSSSRLGGRDRAFGVQFHGERTIDGLIVPAAWRAGWDWQGDGWRHGPFFEAHLDAIRFTCPAPSA